MLLQPKPKEVLYMSENTYKSPLHKTVCISSTDVWNDSCSVEELTYAIENGAVGATTNPIIVGEVLKKEMHLWQDRILEIIKEMPEGTEEDIAWKLNEEMAIKGAELLKPVYDREKGLKGKISIQTNAKYYRNAKLMVEQAVHFNSLAPNIMVKMPVTKAGIIAIEESTYRGVSVNATVSFTVPQAIAVAEAVERGLVRREKEGKDISMMTPVCTIMVGRLDDWIKIAAQKKGIVMNPGFFEWCGVAAMKNAYRIYKQRGYRTRLLAAAYRNHMHWSELIGGDLILTIPYGWQKKFNNSDIEVVERMDNPVDDRIINELLYKVEDFKRAYYEDGMTIEEFDSFGATARTLRGFIKGYEELLGVIRNLMIPDPDKA
jgi:transaldolase